MKRILFICLISLAISSCKKDNAVSPGDSCKLIQLVNSTGTNDFTYEPMGGLSRWLITNVSGTGKTFIVDYNFTRDATGRISSLNQTITYDGKNEGTATAQFAYTNGLLTSASTFIDSDKEPSISRTFTYDTNQRLAKRVVKANASSFSSTETYEYDSRGNCTRYLYSDTDGFTDERAFTYDTSNNPEQLLTKSIPFNLLTGMPWSVNVALTTKEILNDGTGPITLNGQRTAIKTAANGYVTSATDTFDGVATQEIYTLTTCR